MSDSKECGSCPSQSGCGSQQQGQTADVTDQLIHGTLSIIQNKFLVMSGKGGVGKTSVAANLSVALSKTGAQVGLVNLTREMGGLQIGLWNQISSKEKLRVFPIVNWKF